MNENMEGLYHQANYGIDLNEQIDVLRKIRKYSIAVLVSCLFFWTIIGIFIAWGFQIALVIEATKIKYKSNASYLLTSIIGLFFFTIITSIISLVMANGDLRDLMMQNQHPNSYF